MVVPDLPMVSVLMPVLNEEHYINKVVGDILANDYPQEKLELFVIDGLSQDATRTIVRQHAERDPRVHLIDNPAKQKSAALNKGIELARGLVIIRVDAHAEYPQDYVRRLVDGLARHGADNIGSLRVTHVPGPVLAASLAVMVDSKFAAGNAHYRTGSSVVREVESVFGGCFRSEVFDDVGLFDERLIRCQDRDLNDRMLLQGKRIVLDPSFACVYHARSDVRGYLRWQAEGGDWVFRAGFITGRKMARWRNFVPLGFLIYCLSLPLVRFLPRPVRRIYATPAAVYLAADLSESTREAVRHRRPLMALLLLFLFPVNHWAYGLGTLRALRWRMGSNV